MMDKWIYPFRKEADIFQQNFVELPNLNEK